MKYRVTWRANKDIDSIWDYVAQDNPDAADRLDERIHYAIKLLARFPGIGHRRSDVSDSRYLFWTVSNYLIAYRIEGKQLVVTRVLHGSRDLRKLFKRRR